MYRGRPWTIRQYAGLCARRRRRTRASATCSISVRRASRSPSTCRRSSGYDSDDPVALGEVGRTGVAIDSIEDMRVLFEGIPLDRVSTSMTINAPAALLLLLYELAAEEQGVPGTAPRHGPERHAQGVHRARERTSSRRGRRCGSRPTSSRTARSGCLASTRSRSPGTTSARPGRRPFRSSPSRSRTASPTARRRSTPVSRRTTSASACRSSSTRTTTSSRRGEVPRSAAALGGDQGAFRRHQPKRSRSASTRRRAARRSPRSSPS